MGAMRKSVHTPEYKQLLAALRTARVEAGLSQRELGARLKVPHTWVSKVESGERRIDVVEFNWFCEACGKAPLAAFSDLFARNGARRSSRAR